MMTRIGRKPGGRLMGMGSIASTLTLGLLLGFVFLVPSEAKAEASVQFSATVDRHDLVLGETLRLTVTLAVSGGDASDIRLPATPDFDVRSQGRSDQVSMSFGTGGAGRQKIRTYTLLLEPNRVGDLKIQAGSVVVGRERYTTDPIVVRVRNHPSGMPADPTPHPSDPSVVQGQGASQGDVFLQVQVDKREAFVGEQIILSLHLFSRADLSNVGSLQLPKLDGFWIGDIESPTQLSAEMRTVGGVPYRAYLLSKKALFPLREGTMEIDPASVDVTVGSFPFGRSRSYRRSSPKVVVEVKPLPEGAPSGLRLGGVGSWRLVASANPLEVTIGTPITFRITASGVGNLGALALPPAPEVEGLRSFEPTLVESVDIRAGRFGGKKTFEYILVPEKAGAYTLPPLEWLHFDPETESYKVSRTDPISFHVRPGGGREGEQQNVVQGDGGLAPIRERLVLSPATPIVERAWFVWAIALPGLALVGSLIAPLLRRRYLAGTPDRHFRAAGKRALGDLRRIQRMEEARRWEEIPKTLHVYLATRLGIQTTGITRAQLEGRLGEGGVPPEAIRELMAILDSCDTARYAPFALQSGPIQDLVASGIALIQRLEGLGFGGSR